MQRILSRDGCQCQWTIPKRYTEKLRFSMKAWHATLPSNRHQTSGFKYRPVTRTASSSRATTTVIRRNICTSRILFWTGTHPSQPSTPRTMRMLRQKSLKLLTVTPNSPIPPSLWDSPYLTSSIFSQTLSSPSLPSDEDEKWLQDTIPTVSAPLRSLATEGDSPSGSDWASGSVQLSRRAAQKTTIEESQNADCDMCAGVATTRMDSLALLLVPDAHRPKERRFLTVLQLWWNLRAVIRWCPFPAVFAHPCNPTYYILLVVVSSTQVTMFFLCYDYLCLTYWAIWQNFTFFPLNARFPVNFYLLVTFTKTL